jgi:chemotaxis protein CheZ
MANAKLETIFSDQVALIRQTVGDLVPVDQLSGLLRTVLGELERAVNPDIGTLREQVDEMQDFILNARKEISSIRPNAMREVDIPEATDELDAVVMATEEATTTILDSVEKLESICGVLTGSDAAEINSLVVKIYEASNFQDITGQRISKVVNTLKGIELRVTKLVDLFPGNDAVATDEECSEAALLNGPQMTNVANDQNDIDALFDSL